MSAPVLNIWADDLVVFAYHRQAAPFVNHRLVSPVRTKVRFGIAGRTGRLVHIIDAAAATLVEDRVAYGMRWVCGSATPNGVLLRDVPDTKVLCTACDCRAAGPAVYRFFNVEGHLLYVGSTVWFHLRRKQHQRNADWWPDVASEKVTRYLTESEAAAAEVEAIRTENPLHNVTHNPLGRASLETRLAVVA